jgi:hypothetical protein
MPKVCQGDSPYSINGQYRQRLVTEEKEKHCLAYAAHTFAARESKSVSDCHNGRSQDSGMLIWKTLRMSMNVIDSGIHALYCNVYISALTILMMIFPNSSSMLRWISS